MTRASSVGPALSLDSTDATITEAHDNHRLISETTPQAYGYDLVGRRASMAIDSRKSLTYDNANRLTQIAQGTSTVGFSYDNINRRSTLTLE